MKRNDQFVTFAFVDPDYLVHLADFSEMNSNKDPGTCSSDEHSGTGERFIRSKTGRFKYEIIPVPRCFHSQIFIRRTKRKSVFDLLEDSHEKPTDYEMVISPFDQFYRNLIFRNNAKMFKGLWRGLK